MMRVMLYEAAQIMLVRLEKWSWLKVAKHRGMKKAIVALARRFAVIMHRIWVDGTEFRWIKRDRRKTPRGTACSGSDHVIRASGTYLG
jgi:hypothetical protein